MRTSSGNVVPITPQAMNPIGTLLLKAERNNGYLVRVVLEMTTSVSIKLLMVGLIVMILNLKQKWRRRND